MNVVVIPARGGSKRIPRKNIRLFRGRPMIAWSIEAALRCEAVDRVIVSTDDPDIASVATEHGAEVPFIRPAELSDDHTATSAVVAHAIRAIGDSPTAVCCLYATAPFVRARDLAGGLDLLTTDPAIEFVFAATAFPAPVQRAFTIGKDGIAMLFPEHFGTRSQDLEPVYHDAGQFYWGRPDAWLEERVVFSSRSRAVVLPGLRVVDIDTEEDWARAELLAGSMGSGP